MGNNVRTTVILKTDIVEFTPRVAGLSHSELALLVERHKHFIEGMVRKYKGSVIQFEGDAYWIVMPSVTTAVLAALEMHQNLRTTQASRGEKNRLAIRAVVVVGDVMHNGKDIYSNATNLTARIEKVTPPDEIYLSHAAWLILNKAEIAASFVDEFRFKGIRDLERVYKVEQKHRTRILKDQYIVYTDLGGWKAFLCSKTVEDVESFLVMYDDLVNECCDKYDGVIRNTTGDNYFLTFSDLNQTLAAMELLCQKWKKIGRRHKVGLKVCIHKGKLNIYHSYIYGDDIEIAGDLTGVINELRTDKSAVLVLVTGKAVENTSKVALKKRFQEVPAEKILDPILQALIEKHGAFLFNPTPG